MSSGPDADAVEFERAHRRRLRRRGIVIALLALGPLSWLVISELQVAHAKREARLTPSQKAELSALLDRREAIAKDHVAKWNAAVQPEALARLEPGSAECPIKLEPPSQLSAAGYVKFATHDSAFGAWSLCILRGAADAPPCTRKYEPDPGLTLLRARLSEDDVYAWDLAQAKSAPLDPEQPGMVIVAGSEVRPEVHSGAVGRVNFSPGTLSGRGYLFDPRQGRIVCGGDVSVRNSKTVDIEYSHFGAGASEQQNQAEYETRLALERDLELHLRFAGPRALRQLNVSAPGDDSVPR